MNTIVGWFLFVFVLVPIWIIEEIWKRFAMWYYDGPNQPRCAITGCGKWKGVRTYPRTSKTPTFGKMYGCCVQLCPEHKDFKFDWEK